MPYSTPANLITMAGHWGERATVVLSEATRTEVIRHTDAQINSVLRSVGVVVPVTDEEFLEYLHSISVWGSVAEALRLTFPEMANGDDPPDRYWRMKYTDAMNALRARKDIPPALLAGVGVLTPGYTKTTPLFTVGSQYPPGTTPWPT